jgi:hypothetical protein
VSIASATHDTAVAAVRVAVGVLMPSDNQHPPTFQPR